MAVATGTQIRPELSAVDYTPFVQAAAQGAQLQAQSIANLGQTVATGIDQYLKRKEEKQREKDAVTFLTTFINNNPEVANSLKIPLNLKGEVEDPGIVKAAIKTLGGADKALGLATSLQRFEQEKRMAELQMGRMEREAELDPMRRQLLEVQLDAAKSEQAKREREAKNIEAATRAYGAVPQTVGGIVRELAPVYSAPQPKLEEFLYSSGAATPPAVPVRKMPKELMDFAQYGNEGFIVGVDPRTVQRFVGEQSQRAVALSSEIAKLTQAQQSGTLGGVAGRRLAKRADDLKKELEGVTQETRTTLAKIEDYQTNKPNLKMAVESLPPSSLINRTVKEVERKVEREATTDEKTSAFISSYIKNGGTITPDFIDKARDAFKTEMAVYDAGDGVMAVRVGNSAQIIDRGKPLSAAQVKEMKAEQYQKLLSGLAESSEWESLPIDLKKTISELAAAHEKGQNMLGTRMSGQEAFVQRRQELLGAGKTAAPAPAAGMRPAARTAPTIPSGWSVR
jgi:hypothetical protein